MIEHRDIKQSYERLNLWLPKMIKYLSSYKKEDSIEDIEEFLQHSLDIFVWLGSQLDVENRYLSYHKDICNNISTKVVINEGIELAEITDQESLIDNLNYMRVWLKNNYGFDIDSIDIDDIPSHSEVSMSNKQQSKKNNNIYDPQNSFKFINHKTDDFFDKSSLESVFEKNRALMRVYEDANRGKIYLYKTKPKWSPILKGTFSICAFVGLLLSLAILVIVSFSSFLDANLASSTKHFFIPLSSSIFFLLCFNNNQKSWKNDNYKYAFSKTFFILHVCFLTFMLMILGSDHGEQSDHWSMLSLKIFLLICIITNTCITGFGFYRLNPEKNQKLIDDLMSKYESDK